MVVRLLGGVAGEPQETEVKLAAEVLAATLLSRDPGTMPVAARLDPLGNRVVVIRLGSTMLFAGSNGGAVSLRRSGHKVTLPAPSTVRLIADQCRVHLDENLPFESDTGKCYGVVCGKHLLE